MKSFWLLRCFVLLCCWCRMSTTCGDLELFLMGLDLRDLIPLFHQRKMTFQEFLQMTESDLCEVSYSNPVFYLRKIVFNWLLRKVSSLFLSMWSFLEFMSFGITLHNFEVFCTEISMYLLTNDLSFICLRFSQNIWIAMYCNTASNLYSTTV